MDSIKIAPAMGPSDIVSGEPTGARIAGSMGAALVIFGGLALTLNLSGRVASVGTGWASFSLAIGMIGLLFHAAFDSDTQFRRAYMMFGYLLLVFGTVAFALPLFGGPVLFGLGCLVFLLGFLFLLAFLKQETEPALRTMAQGSLGMAGALAGVIGLTGCVAGPETLRAAGHLHQFFSLGLFGLIFLMGYCASRGMSDDFAYRVARLIYFTGLAVFLYALLRSAGPPLLYSMGWIKSRPGDFFIPGGFLLMVLGGLFFCAAGLISSESKLAVLTLREIGAIFFSPIAYFVLVGFTLAAWMGYIGFIDQLARAGRNIEPIVRGYVIDLVPVFAILFIVPAITMRLLSEETKSGSLEVLLTAPVSETTIVLSKFLAGMVMYLVVWAPFGLYLLALPLAGAPPFDYRPLMSFFFGMVFTGAGFIAMGLFFSSITSNQIICGVLTFAGMLGLFIVAIIRERIFGQNPSGPVYQLLMHISFLDVWNNTLEGKLVPKFLLFHGSFAAFWLFLTVKMLESRRWK